MVFSVSSVSSVSSVLSVLSVAEILQRQTARQARELTGEAAGDAQQPALERRHQIHGEKAEVTREGERREVVGENANQAVSEGRDDLVVACAPIGVALERSE